MLSGSDDSVLPKPIPEIHMLLTDFLDRIVVHEAAFFIHFVQYQNSKFYSRINKALVKFHQESSTFRHYFQKPKLGDHQPQLNFTETNPFRTGKEVYEILQLTITIQNWKNGLRIQNLLELLSVRFEADEAILDFATFYQRIFSTYSTAEYIKKQLPSRFARMMMAKAKDHAQPVNFEIERRGLTVVVKNFAEFQQWLLDTYGCSIPEINFKNAPTVFMSPRIEPLIFSSDFHNPPIESTTSEGSHTELAEDHLMDFSSASGMKY